MVKIFVGRPTYNLISPLVVKNQQDIFNNSKHEIILGDYVGGTVENGRQILIEQFLKSDCDYFLNIDNDMVFLENSSEQNPIDVLVDSNKEVVGGVYVYRRKNCIPVYRPLDLQEIYEQRGKFPNDYKFSIPNDIFEVKWIGNGCKLVKRRVIEDVKKIIQCPNLPMIYKDEYISEDWAFDQRARELGYKIYANPKIKLGHVGNYTYTLEDYK